MPEFDESDVNRRYFVHYVSGVARPGAKVLDFGCGGGEVVKSLRAAGYDAYGVDIKWPGHVFEDLGASGLPSGVLSYYEEGGSIPFPDGIFDVVLSNQVLEHVVPLEATIQEMERVLKPDGVMYHHFPTKAVLREGHIGVALAHRLPKGRVRLYYTAALHRLGAGRSKDQRPPMVWAAESLDWIDRWTVYRFPEELESVLGRRAALVHREIDYCRFRAGRRGMLSWVLHRAWLRRPAESAFRRLAFDAVEARPRST